MAVFTALPGFNDLGRLVTTAFLCKNGLYLQLSPHPTKKSMWKIKKKNSRFPSTGHPISFPELRSPWPAVGKRELWEHPFSNNSGNNRILLIRFYCAVRRLHLWYIWRMPEMDAPKALVFRPLVKGNEAIGTRLRDIESCHLATARRVELWSPCKQELVSS